MRILITGANGFVGYYLVRWLLEKGQQVIATGRGEDRLPFNGHDLYAYETMDFTDPFAVHDVFDKFKPEVVIHAGAMSRPDECEQEQWQAYIVNVEGTVTLLMNAAEQGSFFVFLSTDFVFDGEKGMYREDDLPAPVNFYGKTKQQAEEAVQEYEKEWAIVRTVLVYGRPLTGKADLLTIVRDKLRQGEPYRVVDDQVRTPTYVEDLAAGIWQLIEKRAVGIYHLCGEDVRTPYEMAVETAQLLGLNADLLERVTEKEFSQPARRPLRTGLVIGKAKKAFGFSPRSFAEGLRQAFED